MAITVFLCGHGGWNPDDGYFELPKGCSLEFIVHHAKLLPTQDMYKVCGGTYTGTSDRTVGEFKSAPNMSWSADAPGKIGICNANLATNAGVGPAAVLFPNHFAGQLDGNDTITLKKWFKDNEDMIRNTVKANGGSAHFVWNCCSALNLKATANGANFGVNAGQDETTYTFLDLTNGIAPTGTTVAI